MLDSVVAGLTTGSGGDLGDDGHALGQFAIGFVLLPAPMDQGLVRVLDGTPGLRPVSLTGSFGLWQVTDVTARVRVVEADGTVVPVPSGRAQVNGAPVPAAGGTLVLAEPADAGWHASLNGRRLTPLASPVDGWAQGFNLPAGGGRLDIGRSMLARQLTLGLEVLALAVVTVFALPSTRSGASDRVTGAGRCSWRWRGRWRWATQGQPAQARQGEAAASPQGAARAARHGGAPGPRGDPGRAQSGTAMPRRDRRVRQAATAGPGAGGTRPGRAAARHSAARARPGRGCRIPSSRGRQRRQGGAAGYGTNAWPARTGTAAAGTAAAEHRSRMEPYPMKPLPAGSRTRRRRTRRHRTRQDLPTPQGTGADTPGRHQVRGLAANRFALFALVVLALAALFGVAWISRPAAGSAPVRAGAPAGCAPDIHHQVVPRARRRACRGVRRARPAGRRGSRGACRRTNRRDRCHGERGNRAPGPSRRRPRPRCSPCRSRAGSGCPRTASPWARPRAGHGTRPEPGRKR